MRMRQMTTRDRWEQAIRLAETVQALPPVPCSAATFMKANTEVKFDGQLNGHPLHWDIYALMQEIEKLPPSEQQTKVVTLAGQLQDAVATLRDVAKTNAKMLTHYGAECFPEVIDGKKHFVRVLMESAAEELDATFNPQNAESSGGAETL